MTDLERLHELCRLRSTLEAFAVRRWPLNAARSRLERELPRRLAELKQLAAAGDYAAFHAADREFHRVAVEGAGLPALSQSWELVSLELDAWILAIKQSYWPNLMALYREHELLLRAAEAIFQPFGWGKEELRLRFALLEEGLLQIVQGVG